VVHTDIEQPQRQLWLPETAIEAIDELIQILLQIFSGYPMECAQKKGLEVTNGGVYPRQPFVHLMRFGHAPLMLLALSENPQRYQAVGTGWLLGAQASPRKFPNPVGRDRRRRLYGVGTQTSSSIPKPTNQRDSRL
jgi:hypothetical protein